MVLVEYCRQIFIHHQGSKNEFFLPDFKKNPILKREFGISIGVNKNGMASGNKAIASSKESDEGLTADVFIASLEPNIPSIAPSYDGVIDIIILVSFICLFSFFFFLIHFLSSLLFYFFYICFRKLFFYYFLALKIICFLIA